MSEGWSRMAPLTRLLLAGAALRLLAAWGSPGYLMHDDHFLVVEAAASWTDGADYNLWLPWNQIERGLEPQPHPANFFYVGTQFVTLTALKSAGLTAPKHLAFALRLLHGLYSLLIIVFTYRIAEALSGRNIAWWAGGLVAIWGWMPLLSVHQLVELVCIPPLLFSAWQLVRTPRSEWTVKQIVLAGIGLGLATGIRYQCGLFGVGWGLALLWPSGEHKKIQLKHPFILAISSLVVFSLTQISDVFVWGEPFVQLRAYFGYNTTHAMNYPQGPWHQYMWTVLGLATPPVGFALVWGMFVRRVKFEHWRWLLWGTLAFFVFHSAYSNKQERFILPVMPFLAVLGSAGWAAWMERSAWWKERPKAMRGVVGWTVGFNLVCAIGLGFVYAKKSRVEAMDLLYQRGDLRNFAIVQVDGGTLPPRFYAGQWVPYYTFDHESDPAGERNTLCKLAPERPFPNYLLFYGNTHLGEAVQAFKAEWPNLRFVANVAPGRFDRLLAWLNPINRAERVVIYSVEEDACCGQDL